MIAVHIDLNGEYKAVCSAIAKEGLAKRLIKLNEKELPKDVSAYWSSDESVKKKYKARSTPEWKPAKKEAVDG